MIIDFHTHIYPDRIADKAVLSIGSFYGTQMCQRGTLDDLIRTMDEAGVEKSVICSAAVDGEHVRKVNDFILAAAHAFPDRLIGYGTLHPNMKDAYAEAEYILSSGLRGVKFHPDMQHFSLCEDRTEPLYAACEGKLPLLIHTGDRRYHYSNPEQIPPILSRHPGLTLICAHLGGYSEWDRAEACLINTNVLVDCSSSFFCLSPGEALRLIRLYGADRVLFGSDYPMWNMKKELENLFSLGLTPDETENILHRNAEKLLGLLP